MAAMSGWSRMPSTASLSPLTTCRMPSGSPASCISSASISGTEGSRSLGLRMKALPQAIAGHIFHIGIIAGKLNGVMPATTPSGWRIEYMSMPGPAASVNSPFSRCGAPTQNSATSRPRITSPLASGRVLPCSRLSASASLSMSRLSSRTNSIMTRARRCGLVAPQLGWARFAPCTAASSSAAEASGSARLHLAGGRVEDVGEAAGACRRTRLPSMKWPSSCMISPRALADCNLAPGGAQDTAPASPKPKCNFAGRTPSW